MNEMMYVIMTSPEASCKTNPLCSQALSSHNGSPLPLSSLSLRCPLSLVAQVLVLDLDQSVKIDQPWDVWVAQRLSVCLWLWA